MICSSWAGAGEKCNDIRGWPLDSMRAPLIVTLSVAVFAAYGCVCGFEECGRLAPVGVVPPNRWKI